MQAGSRGAGQLCAALLDIFAAVLPLARPPAWLTAALEQKLRTCVQRQPYLTVVHAAIRWARATRSAAGELKGTVDHEILSFQQPSTAGGRDCREPAVRVHFTRIVIISVKPTCTRLEGPLI